MDALRVSVGSVVEWLIAAAFLAATIAVGLLILQDLRSPRTPLPLPVARPAVAAMPTSIPAGAVSVPVLPFRDGKDVRVGDSASEVAARLGRSGESGRQEVDRGALGERLTRFYEYAGFRFIVVFEPFERGGEPRVAAIYLP
ncbi:MAG TPA: hypothetical protein VF159_12790 [Gemmatimonadaceae bacterium]|nr:hypothetical protein [Vicinamibacterales bacterium]